MNKKLFYIALALWMGLFSSAKADDKITAKASNDFGINLYKQVAAGSADQNIFISPYSIYGALAMAYAGSNGNTKAEFEKALNIKDPGQFNAELSRVMNSLNERDGKGFSISVANALWIDKKAKILNSYLSLTEKYYGSSKNQIDVTEPKESADEINSWVADKTKDKIKNLVSPANILPNTELIITNAIYFKGKWQTPFEKEASHDQDFTPLSGAPKKVSMMHMEKNFSYAEFNGAKFLELPYLDDNKTPGENLSMVLILPDNTGEAALKDSETNFSESLLEKFDANKQAPKVNITLPKFKIETPAIELSNSLKALGIKDAFVYPAADFSGIDGMRDLYIGGVIHKAMIEVDEEGTEAAAATGVMMLVGAAFHQPEQVKEFTADRPFIYLIRDNKTGLVLFIGKLLSP